MSIRKAGCLIIGDEVLNGKIVDTNSAWFAKFCFKLGVELKSILVVGDDKQDIIEGIRFLDTKCDFIVTSGGIGPTHDDITYECLAEAYNKKLKLDHECVERMARLRKTSVAKLTPDQLAAQHRMAILPTGKDVRNLFVDDKLWVPIVQINEKVHVFPGVPQLFERLLTGLLPLIQTRLQPNVFTRFFVKTSLSESQMAPYLTQLQRQCDDDAQRTKVDAVKIGSYPHMGLGINTVSIIGNGKDHEYLRIIVKDVEANLEGTEISQEEEDRYSTNTDAVVL